MSHKIPFDTYMDWNLGVFARHGRHADHRLGQAFCIHFEIDNPELFHETDYNKAAEMIREYVDHTEEQTFSGRLIRPTENFTHPDATKEGK